MAALNPFPWLDFRRPGGRLGGLALALVGVGFLCSATHIAPPQSKLDTVFYVDATGRPRTFRGVIKENTLEKTVIEVDGRDRSVESGKVTRIEFGDVPIPYSDASAYFDRKDYENAAAKFQVAAGDDAARDVVKASARLAAAEAWMKQAGKDAEAFTQAKTQLTTFLAEHADDRAVPEARLLLGRAQWLAGDTSTAAETYKSLFAEAGSGGYPYLVCFRAGLGAARASLAAGDVEGARTLFNDVASAATTHQASLDDADPERAATGDLATEARLGEGFCLLAKGSTSQARTFFQGQLTGAPKTGPQRFGARLGLAEALLADGRHREAQLEFALVSSLDYTNRDRAARALVGLAECALALTDTNGRDQAKRWLDTVLAEYGDTPHALRAQELLNGF